jgi:hypothetical protein
MMPQTARSGVQGSKGAQLPVAETEKKNSMSMFHLFLFLNEKNSMGNLFKNPEK